MEETNIDGRGVDEERTLCKDRSSYLLFSQSVEGLFDLKRPKFPYPVANYICLFLVLLSYDICPAVAAPACWSVFKPKPKTQGARRVTSFGPIPFLTYLFPKVSGIQWAPYCSCFVVLGKVTKYTFRKSRQCDRDTDTHTHMQKEACWLKRQFNIFFLSDSQILNLQHQSKAGS